MRGRARFPWGWPETTKAPPGGEAFGLARLTMSKSAVGLACGWGCRKALRALHLLVENRVIARYKRDMALTLQSFDGREHYRRGSVVLIVIIYGVLLTVRLTGMPEWMAALVCLPLYVILIAMTYRRLRDAALSGGWIVFMIFALQFGPDWKGFYLSSLLNFVPVFLGWCAPSNAGANPQAATGGQST